MTSLADTEIGRVADLYVESFASLDPFTATRLGLHEHDEETTDLSPTGLEARAELARSTIAELDELAALDEPTRSAAERRAIAEMRSELATVVAFHDTGENLRQLNVLASAAHAARAAFDVMRTDTAEDWRRLSVRLIQFPDALHTWRMTLEHGRATKTMAARRQALAVADQFDVWGGRTSTTPYFQGLAASVPDDVDDVTRRRLEESALRSTEAFASLADYLRYTYAPDADPVDGVGEERYRLHARRWLGADVDLGEAYEWGWQELARIDAEAAVVAGEIIPGASIPEVHRHLQGGGGHVIVGVDAFRDWAQGLQDDAIDRLHGRVFDIPAEIRRLEVRVAPAGSAAAPYYSPPPEDLSEPGRTWYPIDGKERFPTWGEVSIAYHEGVPGHHLQLATVRLRSDELTRYQVLMGGSSANTEGWALYAERLMGELGFLDDPAARLGMLRAQAFRAARVVVDIGLHLGLEVPADIDPGLGAPPGVPMTPEVAHALLERHFGPDDTFLPSEVNRYLGMPAQATSYKLGERVWVAARAAAEASQGAAFDLQAWHTAALAIGKPGLAILADELAALAP